uniref:glycogenin glucosyltransferase n=1 Tax=Macaca nemestrina TaxID=9545 RepID=A0A2K6BTU5_MACNE
MTDQAFVTLTTNYHRTTRRLAVFATPQVSNSMKKVLETVFNEVIMVNVLDSSDSAHLTIMKRPELGAMLSLTQYSKCVFMDADTLILANNDDLFEQEELPAAPNQGWPNCFNSGIFVYQPSVETYNQLLHLASEQGSFDSGDQDIRKHLLFIYNLSDISIYSYLPAFKMFGASAKVVIIVMIPKQKSVKNESHDPNVTHSAFLILWWSIFTMNVLPLLQQFDLVKDTCSYVNVEDISGGISYLSLGEIPAMAQLFGQADCMGQDSFDMTRTRDTYLQ